MAPPVLVEALETTATGQLMIELDQRVSSRKIGLAHLVVKGSPIPFVVPKPLQFTVVVTAGAYDVERLMVGQACDLSVGAFVLYLDAKEYLHIRDVLANLTSNYPRLDIVYDDTKTQQYDSATIVCLWNKQLAMLLGPQAVAERFGAPRANLKKLKRLPATAVVGSEANVNGFDGFTLAPVAGYTHDEWLLSCIPEKVVHLRPYPAMPATVKLVLVNTTRFNQVIPREGGADGQEFVIATLPPPENDGYAIFNSPSDIRWLPLGGSRRDFVLSLRWSDGTPLVFDTNQVAIGLLCV